MTPETETAEPAPAAPVRRPRIALMGEFSAGKSTLANLMMGQAVSPVKVTATQLPPIWYALGEPATLRVALDGTETPIDPEALNDVSAADTLAVRVSMQADVLEFCDLIDMPGTSDPNMGMEVWERMLDRADGIVWCTPATQAWRQSEAALWESLPPHFQARSLLLITRMDKLLTERDRARVLARVRREVDDAFLDVFPISLTEAIEAGEDAEALRASGAEAFVDRFVGLVQDLAGFIAAYPEAAASAPDATPPAAEPRAAPHRRPEPLSAEPAGAPRPSPPPDAIPARQAAQTPPPPPAARPAAGQDGEGIVMPRRVAPTGRARASRPRLPSGSSPL